MIESTSLLKPIDLALDDREYIFIIDLNEDLYIIEASNYIHHTSLTYGLPVLGAGNMKITSGVIESLGFASGHYMPEISDGVRMIDILLDNHVTFSPDATIVYFYQMELHPCSLDQFIRQYAD